MNIDVISQFINDNYIYYIFIMLILLIWDVMDLFIKYKHFEFIIKKEFLMYYFIRTFICIITLEISIELGYFPSIPKIIQAFNFTLIFIMALQNLVLKVGNENYIVNVASFFESFKNSIFESLSSANIRTKAEIFEKIIESEILTEDLRKNCTYHTKNQDQLNALRAIDEYSDEFEKRYAYVNLLLEWGGIPAGLNLLKKCV